MMTATVRVTAIYHHPPRTSGRERWEVWTEQEPPGWPNTVVFDVFEPLHAAACDRALATGRRLEVDYHETQTWRHPDAIRFVEEQTP